MVNYSRIIGGARVMMKNSSVTVDTSGSEPKKASRLDLVVLELAVAEKVFRRLP